MLPLTFPNVVALATLFSFATIGNAQHNATGNPDSICYSYGVDFVDDGSYFINTASNDSFTSVSTFEGCNQDKAEVLLVDPKGDGTYLLVYLLVTLARRSHEGWRSDSLTTQLGLFVSRLLTLRS